MLNEIVGLKEIMPRINLDWVDEVIAVDGSSTDGSPEFLKQHYPKIKVLQQKSKGICGAYWEAFDAMESDAMIAFSPDNNSIPELIPDVVTKLREGNDLVVVSRYIEDAKSDDDDIVTAFGNWMFTTMVNVLFRARFSDVLVMFRGFTKRLVVETQMQRETTPTFEILLNIRAAIFKRKTCEIPGSEPVRLGGVRKMSPLYNGSTVLILIIKEFFTQFKRRRALKAEV